MDVRIGVIQAPRELLVELADDTDRDALKGADRRGPRRRHGPGALADRPAGPRGRRAGRQDRLRRDRHARRRPPDRLRELTAGAVDGRPAASSTASCSSSPARAASARPPSPPRSACSRRGQGGAPWSARSTPRARWPPPTSAGPLTLRAPRGAATGLGHGHEHRGLAEGVPRPAAARPAAGPPRPAGPHARLRGRRRARRQGDPHRRQALLRGAGAPLRPRGGGRRRPPATSSASWPAPRPSTTSCRWAWCATRRAGCSTSSTTPHQTGRRHRHHARGDAGHRDHRAGRPPRCHGATCDLAAVVVNRVLPELFGRGEEEVFDAPPTRPAQARRGWRLAARRAGARPRRASVLDAAELAVRLRRDAGRAPRRAAERAARRAADRCYVPELFARSPACGPGRSPPCCGRAGLMATRS